MWPTFFIRVSPASRKAKPACMNITSTAAIDDPDRAGGECELLGCHTVSTSLELCSGAVVGDVADGRDPADAVTGSWPVRAASTIASSDGVGDLVAHDEGQVRLRQEPRLEDAAPVLVRDASLAAVADRLDHGDADVAGVLLDGVHHGLDAVADDDRLHFLHLPVLPRWTNKKAPELAGSAEASLPHREPSSAPPGVTL